VRNIPSFEETRRRTPARDASNQKANAVGNDQGREGLLIDFATPPQPAHTGDENIDNPFDTFNATSAIRDEMAATKERDEKERRERERQTILEKREARRKSMGVCSMRTNKHDLLLTFCACSKSSCLIRPRSHTSHLERG
jgi:kinetochore protein Spc7/SPC105